MKPFATSHFTTTKKAMHFYRSGEENEKEIKKISFNQWSPYEKYK